MNIFEDLIEELKEENLLEATVTKTGKASVKTTAAVSVNEARPERAEDKAVTEVLKADAPPEAATAQFEPEESATAPETTAATELEAEETKTEAAPPVNEAEFYQKRAMNEVAFLQIVEHVFAGVEREQLKIVPKPYDDLDVKKVLHNFLQLAPTADENESSRVEFQLLQETESWHSSLTLRDERITTAHLRRFCETSRPPLSSPALVALARFYRNSPFTEPVRNKFDLVVTRLFSREAAKDKREMIFKRDELAAHLTALYAEWSSVPLYATETNDAEILGLVEKFEAYMREADDAVEFDDLIKSDFYTRLHSFKRSANENFYAPLVTAVGIECNIHIGNRYVELLENEKNRGSVAGFEDGYGFAHENTVSDATGKTLSLIELLKEKKPEPRVEEKTAREPEKSKEKAQPVKKAEPKNTRLPEEADESGTLKRIVAGAVIVVLLIAFYFSITPATVDSDISATVMKQIFRQNLALKDSLQEVHLDEVTFVGIVSPAWNQLNAAKRREVLNLILGAGAENGWKRVQLQTQDGKVVGTADFGGIALNE